MMGCIKPGYKKRLDKQTNDWLNGKSNHNNVDDECCPDFSCCNRGMMAPKSEREEFCHAREKHNSKKVSRMLGVFLGRIIDKKFPKNKVTIVTE